MTLVKEFEMNRVLLDSFLLHKQRVMNANQKIMALITDEERDIPGSGFDRILFESLEQTNYFPSQNSMNELIQS